MVIWPSHGTVDDGQTREKFQCLYKNLNSNNFRKTAVLKKKFCFLSFDWDFKENVNRKQTFIRKFIFQFSVELGQLGLLGFHVKVKNFNRNYKWCVSLNTQVKAVCNEI